MDLTCILARLGKPTVLIVGDVMLDRYVWGNAERVCPEAPVLVLSADDDEIRPGGAASVASLVCGLGGEAILAGVVGDDSNGRILRRLLVDEHIDATGVFCDPSRPSTCKERFIGRTPHGSPQQILRVDRETCAPISLTLEEKLTASFLARLAEADVVLVSDYAKGVCTPRLLARLFAGAAERNRPVIVDPAHIEDYRRYAGAAVLVPNRREAELASGRRIPSPSEAIEAGSRLADICRARAVVIKLDCDGMVVVDPEAEVPHEVFPTRKRAVYDVTGAGDMVLAILGMCAAVQIPLPDAVRLANVAAGLEVERLGVAPVSCAEIANEVARDRRGACDILVTLDQITAIVDGCRRNSQKIVFTNGCFDLLHSGHVTYLQQAARLGDVLVVALNSDESVRRLKGPGRPVIRERDRATLVGALQVVDHVLIFDDDTPCDLLRAIRPDVLVKGGNYRVEEVIGREIIADYGGQVCVVGRVDGISTTQIVSALRLG